MSMGRVPMMLAVAALTAQPALAATPTAGSAPEPVAREDVPAENYQPQNKDERGLWMQMDEAERTLKTSPLVIRDKDLNDYVRSVLCRLVGDAKCAKVRIYIVRTAKFNASMAPNGMMQVWSGLLLRTRNEAQLAAVLGHEYTHFENRDSLMLFRDARSKSAASAWLAMTVVGLVASIGLISSIFEYSREMEHQADIGGLKLMAGAGYDTREAAKIWEQLREEMDATALERNTKSKKDKTGGLFASHPPSAERVEYLTEAAQAEPGTPGSTGIDSYAAVMQHHWLDFVDDQLKQNDFGASDYLVSALAKQGWADWLLYARGELYRRRAGEGDLDKAVGFYGEGIAAGGGLPELWRGRGLALLKLGRVEEGRADLNEYLKRAPEASDKAMIAMMAGG